MVTVDGTDAFGLLLDNVTSKPPAGAGPLKLTAQLDVAPHPTDTGFSETPTNVAGLITRLADAVEPVIFAVTRAVVETVTVDVWHAKEVDEDPAGMLATDGPPHASEVELMETVIPPLGAIPFKDIVARVTLPPTTVAGLNAMAFSLGERMVKLADRDADPRVALMVATECDVTATVWMGNVADAEPAGTVTVGGREAAEFELLSETDFPPEPVLLESRIFPVEPCPPTTEDGVTMSPSSV